MLVNIFNIGNLPLIILRGQEVNSSGFTSWQTLLSRKRRLFQKVREFGEGEVREISQIKHSAIPKQTFETAYLFCLRTVQEKKIDIFGLIRVT